MEEKKTVALVEDEPLLSNLLKKRLIKEGFDVLTAKDGEKALELIKNNKVDLILLDIILPKVSGFEFMEEINKSGNYENIPVIIISNLGQESDIKKGKSLGAVGYFVKAHVSIENLVNQIKEYAKENI